MGAMAFAVLMVLEAVVSRYLFGNSWSEHLAHYSDPQAWLGLAGQLVFAAMPTVLLGLKDRA